MVAFFSGSEENAPFLEIILRDPVVGIREGFLVQVKAALVHQPACFTIRFAETGFPECVKNSDSLKE